MSRPSGAAVSGPRTGVAPVRGRRVGRWLPAGLLALSVTNPAVAEWFTDAVRRRDIATHRAWSRLTAGRAR
jgi:hypothetical protein